MKINLKKILKEKNLTQKTLATLTGITESAISRYIKSNRTPNGENLIKMAKALNMTVEELIGE